MSTTTFIYATGTRHAWTTRKGVEAAYLLGHADPSCRRIAGAEVAGIEDPTAAWPCGACVAVEVNPEHVSLSETSAFRPSGPVTERADRTPEPRDPREGEAIEFAKAYEGDFEFMTKMRKECSKVVVRLTPKMIDAILRCKARAEQGAAYRTEVEGAAKADSNVRPNRYAGTCGTCRNEVAEGAGRIEKVGGRWVAFHLAGSCPSEAPQSDGEARKAPEAPTPTPDVPAGRYAFTTDEGHTAFCQVDRPSEGRWAGRVFVSLLIGSPGDFRQQPMKGEQGRAILRKIDADGPFEAAVRFGREVGRCGACNAPLTDPQSIAAGIGPVCRKKYGR